MKWKWRTFKVIDDSQVLGTVQHQENNNELLKDTENAQVSGNEANQL
jgi:hypothetical protein